MLSDKLAEESKRILEKLETLEPGTDEYKELKKDFLEINEEKLREEKSEIDAGLADAKLDLEAQKANLKWYQKLDPNTVFSGVVSLISIGSILNFEKIGIVTSKALSFIHKPRLK